MNNIFIYLMRYLYILLFTASFLIFASVFFKKHFKFKTNLFFNTYFEIACVLWPIFFIFLFIIGCKYILKINFIKTTLTKLNNLYYFLNDLILNKEIKREFRIIKGNK